MLLVLLLLVLLLLVLLLLVFLILLLLLLILLLLLLLFFLVQFFDHLLDDVLVILSVQVLWIDFKRLIVMFERFRPFLGLFILPLLKGAALDERIAEVVFRLSPQRRVLTSKRLAKGVERLVIITLLVRGGSAVEFQSVGIRDPLELILEYVVRVLILLLVVQVETLILGPCAHGRQHQQRHRRSDSHGFARADAPSRDRAPLANEHGSHQQQYSRT